MNFLFPILYTVGLYSAYVAGVLYLRMRAIAFHPPRITILLLLVVAIPSALQFRFPAILSLLQRDYAQFAHGDWWRIVTPLLVQDGGVAGTIANLVGLLLIGTLAEQFWNIEQVILLFLVGGISGELVGFAWQPIGAGNSVANFSLAASLAVACLLRRPPAPVLCAALLALGADTVLLALMDIHGAAALAGALVALLLIRLRYRQKQPSA